MSTGEEAGYIFSTSRPTAELCRELGVNSKTANRRVIARKHELAGGSDPMTEDAET
jgi:hypothetical protein